MYFDEGVFGTAETGHGRHNKKGPLSLREHPEGLKRVRVRG